jgi:hypothetical protein
VPGRSTLMTLAPRSARVMVASGPASTREKSATSSPCRGLSAGAGAETLGESGTIGPSGRHDVPLSLRQGHQYEVGCPDQGLGCFIQGPSSVASPKRHRRDGPPGHRRRKLRHCSFCEVSEGCNERRIRSVARPFAASQCPGLDSALGGGGIICEEALAKQNIHL